MGKNTKKEWDYIIIGAGPAGMTAAITAARRGKKVLILEKAEKAGKKLYATGNGKCNFTNRNMDISCFHGDVSLISEVLNAFSVDDCLDFFASIGITPKDKNGYIYPNSEQAASIVTALTTELKRLQVSVFYHVSVLKLNPQKNGIGIVTEQGDFFAQKLVIATGLKAAPKLGSDGSMLTIIKNAGHRFNPILPTLCGYNCKGLNFKKIAGVRAQGTVSAKINGERIANDTGEIQFTEYGLSGIPIFQVSHFLSKGLYEKAPVEICLNMLPDWNETQIRDELSFRKSLFAKEPVSLLLNGLIPQKLADILLTEAKLSENTLCENLTQNALDKLVHSLTETVVTVTGCRDFEFAQVCTGGIPATQINTKTLESNIIPHLYFAGEILDVDGICGGYNLHFAWATGTLAGRR